MINDLLNYDFKIYQNDEYFKFSIDSVLLAEFVNVNLRTKSIIDLCTGNCPIPMILSTKFNKRIVAVELQKEIYELAKKSIEYNNITNIDLINMDVKDVELLNEKFDIITCNPPYFKVLSTTKVNLNTVKAIARHEIKLTLEEFISVSSKIIKFSGSLYFVHRCERLVEIIDLLKKYKFGLRRLQFVYDSLNSDCCFILVEAKYLCKDDVKICNPIYIDKYLEGVK